MRFFKRFKFAGGRIVKTGIAAFLTAFVCHMLNWPAMFAVMTAIVTVEPTVADSIRKAFIRFPAAAIGAGFAVFFTFLFGDSPYTYAFVSFFTIVLCHKWKLHDGMVVATLTGVAMISTVHDHYLVSFFIRLGTTSIGIIVSALVNFIVMPPNYSKRIDNGIHQLFQSAWEIVEKRVWELIVSEKGRIDLSDSFAHLEKQMDKTYRLFQYQRGEWRFHGFRKKEVEKLYYDEKKYEVLKGMMHHIGLFIHIRTDDIRLNDDQRRFLITYLHTLQPVFQNERTVNIQYFEEHLEELAERLRNYCQLYVKERKSLEWKGDFALFYHLYAISGYIGNLLALRRLEGRRMEITKTKNTSSIHFKM